ncbi:hypothetical protein IM792_17980 [Mucilaginibacter sp. JRF]|nr:hypothetical protein [Mucilaginibacter sp. JRF]MBE9586347.1 hypothetical protein [Mucilaginibacter sp. JRF]
MRVNPAEEVIHSKRFQHRYQRRLNRLMRIAAIALAAVTTYALIFKIVFF